MESQALSGVEECPYLCSKRKRISKEPHRCCVPLEAPGGRHKAQVSPRFTFWLAGRGVHKSVCLRLFDSD